MSARTAAIAGILLAVLVLLLVFVPKLIPEQPGKGVGHYHPDRGFGHVEKV